MRRLPFLILLCLWLGVTIVSAQMHCPDLVTTALETASSACVNIGRNQVCYGNFNLAATAHADAEMFIFDVPGDIVDVGALEELRLSSMSLTDGDWGIALMSLQANLPDSIPGQNVTVLAFGDVALENSVPYAVELSAQTTANARVRSAPDSSTDNVLSVIDAGQTLTISGRTEANDWVFTYVDDAAGWVSSSVLSIAGDVSTLNVVDPTALPARPMQVFTFQSAIGDSACAEAPNSGILVQTPQGVVGVNFTINGVEMTIGSTVYMQASGNQMDVYVVEGGAVLTVGTSAQAVPAGSFSSVPLGNNGLASGAPSAAQPYNATALSSLPVITLPQAITVAPPASQQTIVNASTLLLASGTWQLTQTSFSTSGANCANFGSYEGQRLLASQSPSGNQVTFQLDSTGDSLASSEFWVYPNFDPVFYARVSDGVYHAYYEDNNRNAAGPTRVYYDGTVTFTAGGTLTLDETFYFFASDNSAPPPDCEVSSSWTGTRLP